MVATMSRAALHREGETHSVLGIAAFLIVFGCTAVEAVAITLGLHIGHQKSALSPWLDLAIYGGLFFTLFGTAMGIAAASQIGRNRFFAIFTIRLGIAVLLVVGLFIAVCMATR